MNQGKVIEYIDQGKIICALCLQDKGSRLHLLTPLNRQVNLSPKRAILVSASTIASQSSRDDLLARLRQTDELRDILKNEVRVRDLWELIRDENESFDYKYLAHLSFGETVTDDHVSAIFRAIFEDKLYFKIKDGKFLPNSQVKVEQVIKEKEDEAIKEEDLSRGALWLKDILNNNRPDISEDKKEYIDTLVELALYGKEAANIRYGKELLSAAGISDIQQSRDILIKLGLWDKDEAIDLIKHEISESFSEDQAKDAEKLCKVRICNDNREDLRHLDIFTVDGSLTQDFDDALSVDIRGDYIQVGIHISDVAEIIPMKSPVDNEALQRGSSLYLPGRHIPMIPADLSQDLLSLREGRDRYAISLLVGFDKNGSLNDYKFVPSIVNIRNRFTYSEVNEIRLGEKRFERLYLLSEILRKKRMEQGALNLSLPELDVQVAEDSSLSFSLVSQETPSRMIVAEFMILYNWLASRFCRDNNIPLLYRSQKAPSERLSIEDASHSFYVFKQRRKLNPLVIDTKPEPHSGLGLDLYSNFSSPIRRYLDLVSQRQVRSFLFDGVPVYNNEELDRIRLTVSNKLKILNMIKRNRLTYWIQKHLRANIGKSYPAFVLDIFKSRYRVVLTDFLFPVEIKRDAEEKLSEGENIMVRVRQSDPWNDILQMEYSGH
jgi:exoribonuclease-2